MSRSRLYDHSLGTIGTLSPIWSPFLFTFNGAYTDWTHLLSSWGFPSKSSYHSSESALWERVAKSIFVTWVQELASQVNHGQSQPNEKLIMVRAQDEDPWSWTKVLVPVRRWTLLAGTTHSLAIASLIGRDLSSISAHLSLLLLFECKQGCSAEAVGLFNRFPSLRDIPPKKADGKVCRESLYERGPQSLSSFPHWYGASCYQFPSFQRKPDSLHSPTLRLVPNWLYYTRNEKSYYMKLIIPIYAYAS
jgi:hypothetical protein